MHDQRIRLDAADCEGIYDQICISVTINLRWEAPIALPPHNAYASPSNYYDLVTAYYCHATLLSCSTSNIAFQLELRSPRYTVNHACCVGLYTQCCSKTKFCPPNIGAAAAAPATPAPTALCMAEFVSILRQRGLGLDGTTVYSYRLEHVTFPDPGLL